MEARDLEIPNTNLSSSRLAGSNGWSEKRIIRHENGPLFHPAAFTEDQYEELVQLIPSACHVRGCGNIYQDPFPGAWVNDSVARMLAELEERGQDLEIADENGIVNIDLLHRYASPEQIAEVTDEDGNVRHNRLQPDASFTAMGGLCQYHRMLGTEANNLPNEEDEEEINLPL